MLFSLVTTEMLERHMVKGRVLEVSTILVLNCERKQRKLRTSLVQVNEGTNRATQSNAFVVQK